MRVEPYVPGCIRARLCSPGFGGYDARYLTITIRRGAPSTIERTDD